MSAEIAKMYDDILSKMGIDAVFMPQIGNTVSLKVLFGQSMLPQIEGIALASGSIRTVEAILSDIGQVPERGDIFVIESIEYVVDDVSENNGYIIKCVVGIDGDQG